MALALSFAAVVAALASAHFARDAVRIAQDTERRQLRAYLGISPRDSASGPIVTLDRYSMTNFGLRLRNFGSTPAYKVQARYKISFQLRTTDPETPDFHETGLGITVFPQQEAPGAFVADIPPKILNIWLNGRGWIKISGALHYDDAFGEPHQTPICLEYYFKNGPPDALYYNCPEQSQAS